MSAIPDFTDTELWAVRTTLKERYGHDVEIQLADAELRLDPGDRQTTACPTIFWSERGANFVISKVAEKRYYCQFFYRGYEQFGTGRDRYDDLAECTVAVLQAQADHERDRNEPQTGS